ncbi:MAG: NAD-dependent epimerase/dehydratase family protein [Methylococcaceae bacterium]|nr:NAD-dependent epimerase/dehydratase family protein [Methylococcaceae bacterium]
MTNIGILGASSLVGRCLLAQLAQSNNQIYAFSRSTEESINENIEWIKIKSERKQTKQLSITHWICVAPIWVLETHFPMLEAYDAKRVLALSSTSAISKQDSSEPLEITTAKRLQLGEQQLQQWAEKQDIEWLLLRPTLIYGFGEDKNIAEIARFIKRFSFFPLLGAATGLRMPVHAEDVANACIEAINKTNIAARIYNISGAETLTYRTMIERIFIALGKRAHFIPIPLTAFKLAVFCLRVLPRYQHWSSAMAERMNKDLVFDHSEASRNFGYTPRPFKLSSQDITLK